MTMSFEEIVELKDERANDPARIAEREEANLRYEKKRLAEAREELERLLEAKEECIDEYETIAKRAVEIAVEAEGVDAVLNTEFYFRVTDEVDRLENLKERLAHAYFLIQSVKNMAWWEEEVDSSIYSFKADDVGEMIRELHGDEYTLEMYHFSRSLRNSSYNKADLNKYYEQAHEEIIPREEPEEDKAEETTDTGLKVIATVVGLIIAAAIVMIVTL